MKLFLGSKFSPYQWANAQKFLIKTTTKNLQCIDITGKWERRKGTRWKVSTLLWKQLVLSFRHCLFLWWRSVIQFLICTPHWQWFVYINSCINLCLIIPRASLRHLKAFRDFVPYTSLHDLFNRVSLKHFKIYHILQLISNKAIEMANIR